MTTSAVAVVGRIAYLASDCVVDSQPQLPAQSPFLSAFDAASSESKQQPQQFSLPYGADPGSVLLRNRASGLLAFTTVASAHVLTRLVPHLPELSSTSVVLHVGVKDDLADVLLLRASVPYFIYSSTVEEAHDHALLASRLARSEKKAVVHAFFLGEGEVEEVAEAKIQPFLLADRSASPKAASPTVEDGTAPDLLKPFEAAAAATLALVRRACPSFVHVGSPDAETAIVVFGHSSTEIPQENASVIRVSLFNPLPTSRILRAIPTSTNRVVVLEQISKWATKWTPFYLELASALQERDPRPAVQTGVLGDTSSLSPADITVALSQASGRLELGSFSAAEGAVAPGVPHVPKHEASYTKILTQLFGERLDIANSPALVASEGSVATSPEFALGRVRAQVEARKELAAAVQELLADSSVPASLHTKLSAWSVSQADEAKSQAIGKEIVDSIQGNEANLPAAAKRVLSLGSHFASQSRWIIGSDAWAYDLGASGLHHVIASGLNVNVLVLDTVPYSSRTSVDPARRKHDIGLYAMNHGDVFVASVAIYASYAQVLQALIEAERYPGPSVVLAYLPYATEDAPALDILKETKLAVDAGYWPLYRWNPAKEKSGGEPFSLDSDAIKNDLRAFLDRQNHLSQLSRATPAFAAEIVGSLGENVRQARKKAAQKTYDELVSAIDAPPVTILYASDGGKAEKVAKRLAGRAKARGLSATVGTLDSVSLEDLAQEEYVAFITSVAGQGEFPQNGRSLVKAINAAAARAEAPLTRLKFTVFGMGDSHYWPRPEDAHYYNKAGKDLDARLAQLGGERVAELGLGDDQDPDGPETGYKLWEPLLWKALGVDGIEVKEAEPEPITNEHIKAASQYLRGTIAEGLQDFTTGALSPADTQLTKFHGIYQQDDRDIRDERQAQGVEPAFSFMIRVRLPGGVCTPQQWLTMDQIADEHGNGTLKITTRATFQFHGVIKRHLKPAIQDINRTLLDTLAACGDVNRNVLCSAIPTKSRLHAQVYKFANEVSEHLLPRTTAYHEIWLDKKMVAGEALKDVEPLYGEFYLPRKFKVAVAVPPTNDVDVFANDVGFIAIMGADGELAGFNVTAGGGMGVTHGNKKTYPRTGSILGFCTIEQGKYVAEKIMLVQRDNGNRADRKNARLKYTIDRMGLDVFKGEVEKLLGYKLAPARPYSFDRNIDDYGWHQGEDGKHHVTLFIENGRVQDEPELHFKTGLREIAKIHKGTFRLTANQHLLISDIPPEDLPKIKALITKYKLDNLNFSALRLSSSACVAFPTCGLAMAESERYLPLLVDKVEKICEEAGLRNDSIVMRMTGCPNGCARPYLGEVAFVGKAPGTYLMLLGGGFYGQRLNKIYRESVTEPEILAILGPMIRRYALERHDGEHFGDFVIRAGYIKPTTEGKAWYEDMGGEGENKTSP